MTVADRVHSEYCELKARIEKLQEFFLGDIAKTLTDYHYSLLSAQLKAMETYASILTKRIADLREAEKVSDDAA